MVAVSIANHCSIVTELVELFNLVFSTNISTEMWKWKHLENPLNSAQPKVVVAVDNGDIVGARPLMLANMRVGNEILLAGQPCDTMVHPEYRRRGIFSRMNDLAIEQARTMGVSLFYNFPNPLTLRGNLKQGWQRVMPLESLMRLEEPVQVAEAKFGRGVASKVVGTSYRKFFGGIPGRRRWPEKPRCRIVTSHKAVEQLEGLERLYQEDKIELERSGTYLEWRIDRHPKHKYRYIMCFEDEDLVGYVLVGLSTWQNGLRVGQIVDYMAGHRNADCIYAMFDRAVVELLGMGCDMLRTWAPDDELICDVLKRCLGFRSSLDLPLRLAFRGKTDWLVAREIDTSAIGDLRIYDPAAWRLTPTFFDLA
jgi:GNAT superfamily N-acetyltransferase